MALSVPSWHSIRLSAHEGVPAVAGNQFVLVPTDLQVVFGPLGYGTTNADVGAAISLLRGRFDKKTINSPIRPFISRR